MSQTILALYARTAIAIFVIASSYKVLRHLGLAATRSRPMGGPTTVLDAEPMLSWTESIKRVLIHPILKFPRHTNPVWTWGISLYHIGIFMTVAGYATTAVILMSHLAAGNPVPDFLTGELTDDCTLVNFMTLIFANGEGEVAAFLFGDLGPLFSTLTWVDVACAATGNLLMIAVRLGKLSGAVTNDLDEVTKGLRVSGQRRPINLVVTFVITGIIVTEILARLELVHGIASLHVVLGCTLMLLFPFSYLWHIGYVWIALAYAAGRRRKLALA